MPNYKITGHFYPNMTWEDFLGEEGCPNVTISTDTPPKGVKEYRKEDAKWYDAYVKELTEETAKRILAKINKCTVEEISIREEKIVTAI